MDWYHERMYTPGIWYTTDGGPAYDRRHYKTLAEAESEARRLARLHNTKWRVYQTETMQLLIIDPARL